MTNLLTHEQFVPHENSKFRICTDSDPIEVELTKVSELMVSTHQERFSLTFRGPKDKFLGQGTRLIQHDVLGEFELFLVPLGMNEGGYRTKPHSTACEKANLRIERNEYCFAADHS